MKYLPVDKQLFIANRERFRAKMLPNSVAIFHSADDYPRNGDQTYRFRQNSDFFYLSGIDQEQSILVIYPDCRAERFREALFLRETNDHIAVWEGHKYTKAEATETSGIGQIFWLDAWPAALHEIMANASHVYVNSNENPRFTTEVPYRDLRFAQSLREKYPTHDILRAAPIMSELRVIKSATEIALMQEACNITEKAFRRVLSFVKPGVMEYEVEAEITHEFIRNRAEGHAYSPIIASGGNACILHYTENNRECREGELLLLDFGAEYANYAADLSRTIPVNGRFSPRQRQCYDAVLRVMRQASHMLRPGVSLETYHAEVCKLMEAEMIGLGLFTEEDVKKQDPAKPLFMKYYPHGTSHFLGLDVHDLGFKQQPMEYGMVFTVEPGLYIPEEGIGIRIENDILIREGGNFDLMAGIPVEANDIESLMSK